MSWKPSDPRYHTSRWKRKAKAVLRLRGRICALCGAPATEADHIVPVTPSTPDLAFFSMAGLRPVCGPCNRQRGNAERFASRTSRWRPDGTPTTVKTRGVSSIVSRDYSIKP